MAGSPNIPKRKLPPINKQVGQQAQPSQIQKLFTQGLVTHQQGKLSEAKAIYEQILKMQPNNFSALQLMGAMYTQTKNHLQAIEFLSKAIKINPRFAPCYNNIGLALKELKRLDEALASYDKAISIKPDYAEAHYNRGNVLKELIRLDEALGSYDKAISIKPDYAKAYSNRGIALKELKLLDEALVSYDKAISIKPDFAEAYSNRGIVLQELKRINEALASHDKAISIKPVYAESHWNKSITLLLDGQFAQGWQEYEWRWKKDTFTSPKRNFPQPLWLGEQPLKDKTILLHAEQGVGDTIQFLRYVSLVKALGCQVILEVPKKLISLVQELNNFDLLVEQGKSLPPFDYHCPLMSLPLAFKTEISTIPQPAKYLYAPMDRLNQIKEEIEKRNIGGKLLIGISWRSVAKASGESRSIDLKILIESLGQEEVQYINLQYGDVTTEIEEIKNTLEVEIFQSTVNNYDDMAGFSALIDACDVIVSIDNTTVHLAGALGKNTKVMLPFIADWRWLLDRDDSPWYPSAKLYRQEKIGNWHGVLEKVKSDLEKIY